MKELQNQKIGDYTNTQKVEDYFATVKDTVNTISGGVDANIFSYLTKIMPKSFATKNIVDLGCGDGRWSEYLASLNAKNVYGIDLSEEMIKRATKRLTSMRNTHIIHANMQKLPLKDASIDIGLSTFSMMYFIDLTNVISEINRVLKDGGILYIATNIINIDDQKILKKLYGKSIPIDLGFNQKIHLENLVQTIEQYNEAFSKANLVIKMEKHFKPVGVEIPKTYQYKNDLELEKVLFVVQKNNH